MDLVEQVIYGLFKKDNLRNCPLAIFLFNYLKRKKMMLKNAQGAGG